jgi:hypothetical protein
LEGGGGGIFERIRLRESRRANVKERESLYRLDGDSSLEKFDDRHSVAPEKVVITTAEADYR